jgi:hypothetical protein
MILTTTLNRIAEQQPCSVGFDRLLRGLGKTAPDDAPLPYARIVDLAGIEEAIWCMRAEPQYAQTWRLFAVWCARQSQHLLVDPRSRATIDTAERHARGQATDAELSAAWLEASYPAWEAARVSIGADKSAVSAASAAARDVAMPDAWDAAWFTADESKQALGWKAERTRRGVVWVAVRNAQRDEFLRIVGAAPGKAEARA